MIDTSDHIIIYPMTQHSQHLLLYKFFKLKFYKDIIVKFSKNISKLFV